MRIVCCWSHVVEYCRRAYSEASCNCIAASGADVVWSRSRVGHCSSRCLSGGGKSVGMVNLCRLVSSAEWVVLLVACWVGLLVSMLVVSVECSGVSLMLSWWDAVCSINVDWKRSLRCKSDGVLNSLQLFFEVKLALKVRLGCASLVSESL